MQTKFALDSPLLLFLFTSLNLSPSHKHLQIGQRVKGKGTLEQPNIEKEHAHRCKEQQPNLPPHARPLSHDEHAVHSAAQSYPRRIERVVHLLCQGRGLADFIADSYCHL